MDEPMRSERNFLQSGIVGEHCDDHPTGTNNVLRVLDRFSTAFKQRCEFAFGAVINLEFIARLQKILGHRRTHVARPYKPNGLTHADSSLELSFHPSRARAHHSFSEPNWRFPFHNRASTP